MGKTVQPDWAAMMSDQIWHVGMTVVVILLSLLFASIAQRCVVRLWKHIRNRWRTYRTRKGR